MTLMRMNRRSVLAGAAATPLAMVAAPYVARGQSGVIKLLVPFPPGGSVDPIARMAQPSLQQRLGQTVIVENKPGASGSIGAAQVAKSPPDGTTWLFVFDTHAVNPVLIPNMPFDSVRDLDPVMLIGTAPYILACHPSRPWKTFADMVAAAKAKPDTISFGSVGSGSIGHLAMTQLGKRAGAQFVHSPYRGGGPAMNDALGGHIDSICGSAAITATQLKAEKLRGILSTGAKRMAAFPDIPTAAESGFPGFEAYAWWGVFAPANTPKEITDKFVTELRGALQEERAQKQLSETLQVDMRLGGPDELRTFFAEQMRVWGDVVRENNIKTD
ncbi:tripartite tricarboxylate transporter family receptor [Variibacter gotjawalensis]|uniref:Tripartite tricarboxylate transporter family receptor n=1 Tax=Variibacter gotjawalensis TaxID=1333996 RepID=A0A0S3PVB0_9BRAD|nr:tripartite tricarboxylate transporter substrate binding protein [Variibacter gotjawalensis]NIK45688.1 tripartite-type tricarboxylate transporter receptor subunit TctC [Variibacter gotjawalensis]RZS47615.1 tripartite-type tricarboxylate transporter receptor subunit TctC [Variibacter gotjawalensis]BAT59867.1 tripartite tricarboxylate transporter family receptor [Variibacter gotjawalensis]